MLGTLHELTLGFSLFDKTLCAPTFSKNIPINDSST